MNLKKIIHLVGKKNLFTGFFILLGSIILIFFEMLGLGLIPIFIALILNPSQLYEKVPFIENVFIDNGIDFSNTLLAPSLIILAVFIIKNFYSLGFLYCEDKFYTNLRKETSQKLLNKYLFQKYNFFLHSNSSILTRNIVNESKVAISFISFSLRLLKDIFLSLTIIVALLIVNPEIVITTIFILLLLLIYYIIIRKKIFKLSELSTQFRGKQFKYLTQIFNNIKIIKLRGNENYFIKKFSKANYEEQKISLVNSFIVNIPRHIIELTSITILLGLIYYLIEIKNISFEESIPLLTFFSLCFLRLIPTFNSISACMVYLRGSNYQFLYITDEILKLDSNSDVPQSKNIYINKSDFKKILIKDLDFSYNNKKKLIFKNLNLEIPSNSNVCLIGKSGEGKSTFADLVMGLLEPDKGDILLDGLSIKKFLPEWKAQIGYIPQNIYLNDDTIRKNIALGLEENEINEQRLNKVVQLAELNEFVEKLPDRLNTIVGEKGVNISGGQIQRIGIARALYPDPRLLILDEATSSLDTVTEKKIVTQINKLKEKYTIITITHKKEVAQMCDVILEVKDNNIFKVKYIY